MVHLMDRGQVSQVFSAMDCAQSGFYIQDTLSYITFFVVMWWIWAAQVSAGMSMDYV